MARRDVRYAGQERDRATGLHAYPLRYFAPWLGRWLSPDPIGPEDDLNLYQFVGGDPIGKVDPRGTEGWPWSWMFSTPSEPLAPRPSPGAAPPAPRAPAEGSAPPPSKPAWTSAIFDDPVTPRSPAAGSALPPSQPAWTSAIFEDPAPTATEQAPSTPAGQRLRELASDRRLNPGVDFDYDALALDANPDTILDSLEQGAIANGQSIKADTPWYIGIQLLTGPGAFELIKVATKHELQRHPGGDHVIDWANTHNRDIREGSLDFLIGFGEGFTSNPLEEPMKAATACIADSPSLAEGAICLAKVQATPITSTVALGQRIADDPEATAKAIGPRGFGQIFGGIAQGSLTPGGLLGTAARIESTAVRVESAIVRAEAAAARADAAAASAAARVEAAAANAEAAAARAAVATPSPAQAGVTHVEQAMPFADDVANAGASIRARAAAGDETAQGLAGQLDRAADRQAASRAEHGDVGAVGSADATVAPWKPRRTFSETDSGLKDHALRHSDLSPAEYLRRGQENVRSGIVLKGGGAFPNALYWIRRLGPDDFSLTITNRYLEIFSIDTWRSGSLPLTREAIERGLKRSGVTPPRGFWDRL